MRDLLTKCGDAFSTRSVDLGSTCLVEHHIPLLKGTTPIRELLHRLGPEKEAEAEKQVTKLLKQEWIELDKGACGSPVVLVKKKDGF